MHPHTVHLPVGALLIWCTVCGTGYYLQPAERRLGLRAFFRPANYARSTLSGVEQPDGCSLAVPRA